MPTETNEKPKQQIDLETPTGADNRYSMTVVVGLYDLDFEVFDGVNKHPWFTGSMKWDGCMQIRGVHLCDEAMTRQYLDVLLEIHSHGKLIPEWDGD